MRARPSASLTRPHPPRHARPQKQPPAAGAAPPPPPRTHVRVRIAFHRTLAAADGGSVLMAAECARLDSQGALALLPAGAEANGGHAGAGPPACAALASRLLGGLALGGGAAAAGTSAQPGGEGGQGGAALVPAGVQGAGAQGEGACAWDTSGAVFLTDSQLRRARTLFPCVDDVGRLAAYELTVRVPPACVAVCGGELRGSELCVEGGAGEVGAGARGHVRVRGHVVGSACMCATAMNRLQEHVAACVLPALCYRLPRAVAEHKQHTRCPVLL